MKALNSIKNPRITEKASFSMEKNIYVFDVSKTATKTEVAKAIFALYKIKPVKVNILRVPKKKIMVKGKEGIKGGGKKAVVYLKEGDKIEIV